MEPCSFRWVNGVKNSLECNIKKLKQAELLEMFLFLVYYLGLFFLYQKKGNSTINSPKVVFFSFGYYWHLNFDLGISDNENCCGNELAVTICNVENSKLDQTWAKNVFSGRLFRFDSWVLVGNAE